MAAKLLISCLVSIWNIDDPRNAVKPTVFLHQKTLRYYKAGNYIRPSEQAERYKQYHIHKLMEEHPELLDKLSCTLDFHLEVIK